MAAAPIAIGIHDRRSGSMCGCVKTEPIPELDTAHGNSAARVHSHSAPPHASGASAPLPAPEARYFFDYVPLPVAVTAVTVKEGT